MHIPYTEKVKMYRKCLWGRQDIKQLLNMLEELKKTTYKERKER